MPAQPVLDHIVILVPHDTLINLPSWITDAFTVITGGKHADGVSENKLILFADGVYLELMAFVPGQEEGRKTHAWGQHVEGHIVEWANTLSGSEDELKPTLHRIDAAKTGIQYTALKPGGRFRPDGAELKWAVSAAYLEESGSTKLGGFVGGELPFWCLDRTPRELRVPYSVEKNVKHPSGALGVAGVHVSVRSAELFRVLKATYDALQGHEGRKFPVDGSEEAYSWDIYVLDDTVGQKVERKLTLALLDAGKPLPGALDVNVELSLVTEKGGEPISGTIGDENWLVKFNITQGV